MPNETTSWKVLGKIGMKAKGAWENITDYKELDIVTYNNKIYIAKENIPASLSTPENNTKWDLLLDGDNFVTKEQGLIQHGALTSEDDIDNFTTAGQWILRANVNSFPSNWPSDNTGRLIVFGSDVAGTGLRAQMVFDFAGDVYTRYSRQDAGWTPWKNLLETDTTLTSTTLPANAKATRDAISAAQTTVISNSVHVNDAQSLTAAQQSQARENIDAASTTDIAKALIERGTISSDDDIDGKKFMTSGQWRLEGGVTPPTTWPSDKSGRLIVFGNDQQIRTQRAQIVFDLAGDVYVRYGSSNAWTTWKNLTATDATLTSTTLPANAKAVSDAISAAVANGTHVNDVQSLTPTQRAQARENIDTQRIGDFVQNRAERGHVAVIANTVHGPLKGLKIHGRSIPRNSGTPSPSNPLLIVTAGEGGAIEIVSGTVNLLPSKPEGDSGVSLGITFTTGTDGRVTANGTSTGNAQYNIPLGVLPPGTYTLTGCPSGGSVTTWLCYVWDNTDAKRPGPNAGPANNDHGSGLTFTAEPGHDYSVTLRVCSGATADGLVFEPMVTTVAYDDVAYHKCVHTIATIPVTGGLPGIKVTSGFNYIDSDGQGWICDEIDLETGIYTQRVMRVNGAEAGYTGPLGDINAFALGATASTLPKPKAGTPVLADSYAQSAASGYAGLANGECIATDRVYVRNTACATTQEMVNTGDRWFIFVLETPQTYQLSEAVTEKLKSLYSVDGSTAVYSTSATNLDVAATATVILDPMELVDTVETMDGIWATTRPYVRVMHDTSFYGDGGPCLFSAWATDGTGSTWGTIVDGQFKSDGYPRADGTILFPVASQSDPPESHPPMRAMVNIIKSYVGNTALKYGNDHTLFDETILYPHPESGEQNEIDCSAFVDAVLSGISYEGSRYKRNTGLDNIRTVTICKDRLQNTSGGKLTTWRLAQYFGEQKRLFKTPTTITGISTTLRPGDILFFSWHNGSRDKVYYSIGHVAIVLNVFAANDAAYVVIAQGGGAPAAVCIDDNDASSRNEQTVCNTATIKLTPENIATWAPVFARPRYEEELPDVESLSEAIVSGTYTFRPLFVPNSYINGNSSQSLGTVLHSSRSFATRRFYDAVPGATINYTGAETGTNSRSYNAFIAEYDANMAPLKVSVLYDGMNTKSVTLTASTRFVRFYMNYVTVESVQKMTYADTDNFKATMTL